MGYGAGLVVSHGTFVTGFHKNKRVVAIRVDGDSLIGTGHVFRMISLAKILSAEFQPIFVMQCRDQNLIKSVEDSGFDVVRLPVREELSQELVESSDIFAGSDIVVLDGYRFDLEYQCRLLELGKKLVYVDDIAQHEVVAHVLINHAPSASHENYKVASHTRTCFGLNYGLVDPVFFRPDIPAVKPIEKVAVCLGGADAQNYSGRILGALGALNGTAINVVLGPSNKHFSELSRIAQSMRDTCPNVEVNLLCNLPRSDMANLLKSVDLLVCSASSIAIEGFAAKVPILGGVTASNQRRFHDVASVSGLMATMGDLSCCGDAALKESLRSVVENHELRARMLQLQATAIDNFTPARLRQVFLSI